MIGRTSTPGAFISTSKKLIPLCLGASGSVLANINNQSASCAPEVHIFVPLITKSSPSSTALVCKEAKSEPD